MRYGSSAGKGALVLSSSLSGIDAMRCAASVESPGSNNPAAAAALSSEADVVGDGSDAVDVCVVCVGVDRTDVDSAAVGKAAVGKVGSVPSLFPGALASVATFSVLFALRVDVSRSADMFAGCDPLRRAPDDWRREGETCMRVLLAAGMACVVEASASTIDDSAQCALESKQALTLRSAQGPLRCSA